MERANALIIRAAGVEGVDLPVEGAHALRCSAIRLINSAGRIAANSIRNASRVATSFSASAFHALLATSSCLRIL